MRSGLESTSGRSYGAWVQSTNWVRFVLRAAADRRARHARRVQHRQLAPAVGHPDQGHQDEHVAVRAGRAGQAARILARAVDAGSARHLLRRQRDADDAAADDSLRRALSERRQGRRSAGHRQSRGSIRPACRAADRAGAAIANTATDSGSASSPATRAITRGATAGNSSSSFPAKTRHRHDLALGCSRERRDHNDDLSIVERARAIHRRTASDAPGSRWHRSVLLTLY